MILAKLSSKHQVVLPKPIRDQIPMTPGDLVELVVDGNCVVLSFKKVVDRDHSPTPTAHGSHSPVEAETNVEEGSTA